MPSILDEQVLSLNEASKVIPRVDGRRPHLSSLWRWARVGLRASNGQRISLEYARLGRRIVTSREALTRFAQRLAEADEVLVQRTATKSAPRTDAQRAKAIAQASRELEASGI